MPVLHESFPLLLKEIKAKATGRRGRTHLKDKIWASGTIYEVCTVIYRNAVKHLVLHIQTAYYAMHLTAKRLIY